MLGWIWGTVMFLAVFSVALSVALWICRALFGATVTALLLGASLLWAAYLGWQWLVHSDHLGLQVLGWILVGLTAWIVVMGVRWGIRQMRAPTPAGETRSCSLCTKPDCDSTRHIPKPVTPV